MSFELESDMAAAKLMGYKDIRIDCLGKPDRERVKIVDHIGVGTHYPCTYSLDDADTRDAVVQKLGEKYNVLLSAEDGKWYIELFSIDGEDDKHLYNSIKGRSYTEAIRHAVIAVMK